MPSVLYVHEGVHMSFLRFGIKITPNVGRVQTVSLTQERQGRAHFVARQHRLPVIPPFGCAMTSMQVVTQI